MEDKCCDKCEYFEPHPERISYSVNGFGGWMSFCKLHFITVRSSNQWFFNKDFCSRFSEVVE